MMPGENIWLSLWIDDLDDFVYLPTSGTSMAAALMTGVLVLALEKHKIQAVKILKKNSKKLDFSWSDVSYGFPKLHK